MSDQMGLVPRRIVDFADGVGLEDVMGALIGINEHVKRIADVMEAQFVQEMTGTPYIPGNRTSQKPLWGDLIMDDYSGWWEEKDGKLQLISDKK